MKETGSEHWNTENTGATNLSGLSLRGTGYWDDVLGSFTGIGSSTSIVSSTALNDTITETLIIPSAGTNTLWDTDHPKANANPVRCIKD
jgi:hypothetical protein